MPFTPVREIELIEIGSLGKETLSNDAFVNLSRGISGTVTLALTGTTYTLTETEAQACVLILTGTLTANVNLIVPAASRVYVVDNRTSGAFTVTCRPAAGGGVAVDQSARTLMYCDGSDVYPVASGTGGGGGSGAPTDASYLVGASHTMLSGERVVTDTSTITWDLGTAGQARAIIPPDAVSYAHLQNVAPTRLLGRFTAGSGDVQEITPGTGLTLDAGGVLSATAVGQPLDATLTALAGLATGANQLPYSTGTDTFAQTLLTAFARTVLDDADAATLRGTISAQASDATLTALAGVTTAADALPFFTGVDTASTTTLTAFMRSVLDDPDLATAQATLGITGGGGGSSDFLGLSDTPNSYSGQAGKGVVVNGAATALEFTTAATGSYDLGVTWSGTLPASQVLMRYPFPRAVDFPAGLAGSQGRAAASATALTTLDLRKNTTSVGSVQFAAAGTTATFTMASATSFEAGDVLTVHAPASADATLADLGLSLAGTRAVVAGEMGATTFLGLADSPDTYTGHGAKIVQVNAAATALEFVAQDPELAALSVLVSAADRVPYFTGSGTAALATFTAAGRTLVGAADAAAQRTALALGTMAPQDASAVAITGGSATGLSSVSATNITATNNLSVTNDLFVTDQSQLAGPVGMGTSPVVGQALTTVAGLPVVLGAGLQASGTLALGGALAPTIKAFINFARASQYGLVVHSTDADSGANTHVGFSNVAGAIVGTISCTAAATAYNTSSDARLKEGIQTLVGALDVLRALKPVAFRWQADGSQGYGFLAHELQREIPDAVSGQPDEVNADGSVKPQQVDHSRLVVWCVAALQETLAQVQALTARVTSLEEQLGV